MGGGDQILDFQPYISTNIKPHSVIAEVERVRWQNSNTNQFRWWNVGWDWRNRFLLQSSGGTKVIALKIVIIFQKKGGVGGGGTRGWRLPNFSQCSWPIQYMNDPNHCIFPSPLVTSHIGLSRWIRQNRLERSICTVQHIFFFLFINEFGGFFKMIIYKTPSLAHVHCLMVSNSISMLAHLHEWRFLIPPIAKTGFSRKFQNFSIHLMRTTYLNWTTGKKKKPVLKPHSSSPVNISNNPLCSQSTSLHTCWWGTTHSLPIPKSSLFIKLHLPFTYQIPAMPSVLSPYLLMRLRLTTFHPFHKCPQVLPSSKIYSLISTRHLRQSLLASYPRSIESEKSKTEIFSNRSQIHPPRALLILYHLSRMSVNRFLEI